MGAGSTAVIVLNWNGIEDTRLCLRSLERVSAEWDECIVVDNGSTDGSGPIIRREFPWARLIETGENLGYAGGNNRGIRAALDAGARSIFVLNNDAVAPEGSIGALRSALDHQPDLGILGPVVRHRDGSGKLWYAGGEIQRSPFRSKWVKELPGAASGPCPVDYVPGCALLLSRDMLERIGPFDERFFLIWEDTDLSVRARDAGFGCAVLPGAAVEHDGSASFGGSRSPLYSYYYFRNMLLFARLHFPLPSRPRAYRDTIGFARAMARKERSRADRRKVSSAIALGILHFAVRRFGPAPAWLAAAAQAGRVSIPAGGGL